MSHYWSLEGTIELERPPTLEELQAIADKLETDIGSLEAGIGWNCDESIKIVGNKIHLYGEENHFPSTIDDILIIIECDASGEGTYHAEDNMAGDWWIDEYGFSHKDYELIVTELRAGFDYRREL